MAIYHLHVKVIGRKSGSSAVASAAYRSASRLHEDWLDRDQDFSAKRGVVHSEVLLPEHAPNQWSDRERLWNDVEAFEVRKDAQLAREVEFAIPREMSEAQGIELARDFVQSEFVDRGMIADLNVHWDIGEDGMPKPHAHVMLTMREVDEDEAEGIEAAANVADRAEMHREIARNNGAHIIADPSVALEAITQQQSTFTRRDMAMFAHRHSDGIEQFNEVMGAMRNAPDLIELGKDGRGVDRFTTQAMIESEQRLHRAAEMMAERERHEVNERDRQAAPKRKVLSCQASRPTP